jgi:hypothetical protein
VRAADRRGDLGLECVAAFTGVQRPVFRTAAALGACEELEDHGTPALRAFAAAKEGKWRGELHAGPGLSNADLLRRFLGRMLRTFMCS